MKRAMLIGAVAALCVAGSAVAQDRSGGLIGSGTRTDDGQVVGSGNAASQTMGSGGFTTSSQDSGQIMGSGTRSGNSGQVIGSGGFTASTQDSGQWFGNGGRSADGSPMFGSGGFTTSTQDSGWLGNGGRSEDGSPIIGSGSRSQDGGYLGSGLAVRQLRLLDGSSLLVVSSGNGTFLIPFEE